MTATRSAFATYTLVSTCIVLMIDYCSCVSRAEELYSKENPSARLPNLPSRLTPSGWTGVPSAVTCALKSSSKFRGSQGFLYNHQSGLCSPLLWLEGPSSPGALSVLPGEGTLYLAGTWCTGSGFQLEELSTGELVCLAYFNTITVDYLTANEICSSLDSYLVSVKTVSKLELVKTLATASVSIWVGMDDFASNGTFVWSSDGEVLTNQQINDVFHPGEPNYNDFENCVELSHDFQKLNDVLCDRVHHYICEKDLPRLESEERVRG